MKKILFFFFFFLSVQNIFSQSQSIDSILQKIAVEKDEDKKVDLIISIWNTGFDRDPYLVIKTGQALLSQAQENNDIIKEASA